MDANGIDGIARSLAAARTRRSLLKGLAAGLGAVAAAKFGLGEASAANGNEQFVYDYYDAIQKHAWSKAYNLLGGKFHQAQSLDDFIAGFAETVYAGVDAAPAVPVSGNRYRVQVEINAWLSDGTPQVFTGHYDIGREGGVPKIVDAELEITDASAYPWLCVAGQLSASAAGGSATGHRYSEITVTNTGGICALAGMPSVSLKDKLGHKLIKGKRGAGSKIPAMYLDSGESRVLSLDWVNWCGDAVDGPVKATVALPGHMGSLSIPNAIGVPPCLSDPGSASSLSITPWQFG